MSLAHARVLIFAAPLYEDLELWYPKIRLEEEGATVVVAGLGEKTYQGKRGYPVALDTSVDRIRASDFDALVIPGGYAPDILRRHEPVLRITREIFEAGKPVAFICHAGWVPISAGIVRGRRGTSVGAIRDDLVNAGMEWEDSPVVVDGNMITSRTPADLPHFCKAIISALEATKPARDPHAPADAVQGLQIGAAGPD
jgi:protease I